MVNKNVTVKDTSQVTRQFKYSNGDVTLNFSLRIDVKSQLKTFKELLEAALRDVTEELNKK